MGTIKLYIPVSFCPLVSFSYHIVCAVCAHCTVDTRSWIHRLGVSTNDHMIPFKMIRMLFTLLDVDSFGIKMEPNVWTVATLHPTQTHPPAHKFEILSIKNYFKCDSMHKLYIACNLQRSIWWHWVTQVLNFVIHLRSMCAVQKINCSLFVKIFGFIRP